jgi:hypothetical protein
VTRALATAWRELDRVILQRGEEQSATVTARVGSGRRDERRQDVVNAPPEPRA